MQELTNCEFCGSLNSKTIVSGRDRLHGRPGEFAFHECQICGLIYLSPRPDSKEIAQYYPENYISFPKAIEDESSWFRRLDRGYGLYKRVEQVVRRVGKPGRILDIGCATGIFLEAMRRQGWDVFGIEPLKDAALYAQQRFNLPVHFGFLEDAAYPDQNFDLITMWDVLEHVSSPGNALSEIARIIKPGGFLILSLPNLDSWECDWFGKYWAGWDIPRHLNLFTSSVIKAYFQKTGFGLEEVTSFTGRHGAMVLNFEFIMSDWEAPGWLKKTLRIVIKSMLIRLAALPYYAIAESLNKSSFIVFIARRN